MFTMVRETIAATLRRTATPTNGLVGPGRKPKQFLIPRPISTSLKQHTQYKKRPRLSLRNLSLSSQGFESCRWRGHWSVAIILIDHVNIATIGSRVHRPPHPQPQQKSSSMVVKGKRSCIPRAKTSRNTPERFYSSCEELRPRGTLSGLCGS